MDREGEQQRDSESDAPPQGGAPVLSRDLPCIACGTSLQGADPRGDCASCGAQVSDSLRPELLRFGSRHLLRAIVRGLATLLAGLACYAIAVICELFVIDLRWSQSRQITGLMYSLPAMLLLVGTWRATRGGSTRFEGIVSKTRLPARWLCLVGLSLAAAQACWLGITGTSWPAMASVLAGVFAAVGFSALAAHLADMVARTGGAHLAGESRALAWTILATAVFYAVGVAADPWVHRFLHGSAPRVNYTHTGVVTFYAGVAATLLGAWALTVLWRLYAVFAHEQRLLRRFRESSREVGLVALSSLLAQNAK